MMAREVLIVPANLSAEQSTDRLISVLSWATFLEWMAAGAFLPMLPAYLKGQGGSPATIGLVMASFFVAGVVGQYPAGKLADLWGRRPVIISGLLLYSVASLLFLLHVAPLAEAFLRFLQGLGAGAVEIGTMSLVGVAVAPEFRGRAYAKIVSRQFLGLAIGPIIGSVAGVEHMDLVFLLTGGLSGLALIPMIRSSTLEAHSDAEALREPSPRPKITRPLLGSILAMTSIGLTIGVYESCWTLLMEHRGATALQVGISWTLFCLPFMLGTRPAGWLADHRDRRWLVLGSITSTSIFLAIYAGISSIPWLLSLAMVESIGASLAIPSAQSLVAQFVPAGQLGRAQGMVTTGQTAATAVSAMVAGSLFGIGPAVPFIVIAVVAISFPPLVAYLWRDVEGHSHRHEAKDTMSR